MLELLGMKRGIAGILSVAIIGSLGIYSKSQAHGANTSQDTNAVLNANKPQEIKTEANRPTAKIQPLPVSGPIPTPPASSGFKDGTFTGRNVSTIYGPVQIQVVISGGKIVDVRFVTMPDGRGRTIEITNESGPLLEKQTLAKQSADIDFVSGATQTSEGYQQSLQSALDQAS